MDNIVAALKRLRSLAQHRGTVAGASPRRLRAARSRWRTCRLEPLEGRTLLSTAGNLLSATAGSPIALGLDLPLTATVKNTGTDTWVSLDYPAWLIRVENPSWSPSWSYINYFEYGDVSAGQTVSATASFSASDLPGAPGDYSFQVRVAPVDQVFGNIQWAVMTGNPKTVNFTIVSAHTPTDISLAPANIAENQPPGTVAGTFSTADPIPSDTFTYTLVPGTGAVDNASFTVAGSQLTTTATFDFEAKASYSIRVRTTDSLGLWYEKSLAITVTDANLAPTDLSLSGASVAENQAPGTVVGTLATVDPEPPAGPFTYSLVSGTGDADNASFTISGDQLTTTATFDFEAKASYSIRVRSTDSGGLWYEKPLTITVTNVNEAPAAAAGGPYVIDKGQDLVLNGAASFDPDASSGDSIASYEWDLGADGSYEYSGDSPTVSGADLAGLPLRVPVPLQLRVTDTLGLSATATTSVTIYDNRPLAAFTAVPNPAAPGQAVSFNASASSHGRPDRTIVSYAWDFGDGQTANGLAVEHAYAAFGAYTASLTVTDDNVPAKTATATTPIVVNIDAYEANNTQATAYDLSAHPRQWLSAVAGLGTQADDDWYKISLAPMNRRLTVELSFTNAQGNIDLEVVDPAGNVKRSSASISDGELIDYVLPATGDWYLRVFGANAANTYDLWWSDVYVHPGDATLNGKTDIADLNIWSKYRYQAGTDWTQGDFSGDGKTDVSDLNIWMAYRYTSAPAALTGAGSDGPAAAPLHDAVLQQAAPRTPSPQPPGRAKLEWLLQFDRVGMRSHTAKKEHSLQNAADHVLAVY